MEKYTSPIGRVSFPNVFEPKAFGDGAPKFSIQILLPKGAPETEVFIKKMAGVITEVMAEKWPDINKRPKKPQLQLSDGDTWESKDGTLKKDIYPEVAGMWVLRANANEDYPPVVVDRDRTPILSKRDFYAGCYARIIFSVFAYDNQSKGIGFGLLGVQKDRDGDSFSAAQISAEDFGELGPLPESIGPAEVKEETGNMFA